MSVDRYICNDRATGQQSVDLNGWAQEYSANCYQPERRGNMVINVDNVNININGNSYSGDGRGYMPQQQSYDYRPYVQQAPYEYNVQPSYNQGRVPAVWYYRQPDYRLPQGYNGWVPDSNLPAYNGQQIYPPLWEGQQYQQGRYGWQQQNRYYQQPDYRYSDPRSYYQQQQYDRYNDPRYYYQQQQYDRYNDPRYSYQQDYRYNDPRYYQQQQYNRYYQQDGRYYNQQQMDPSLQRLGFVINGMVGHSVREWNPQVPERLGCATFCSAALNRAYGLPIYDTNVDGLERSVRRYGFVAVPLNQAQPGDVIIGKRYGGDHGHAAIYCGNGRIANNSSVSGRVEIQPVNKFYASDFQSVVAYRRVG